MSAALASGAIAVGIGGVALAEGSTNHERKQGVSTVPSFPECAKLSKKPAVNYRVNDAVLEAGYTIGSEKEIGSRVKYVVRVPSLGNCEGQRSVRIQVENKGDRFYHDTVRGNSADKYEGSVDSYHECPYENAFSLVVETKYKEFGRKAVKSKDRVRKPQYDRGC